MPINTPQARIPAPSSKVLGFNSLFAASIGVIVAQLGMVTVMQGVGIGGWGFFAAMSLAFLLALANAMAYAEMALMMPNARSLSSYAEAALGNFPAILLVFAGYVTPVIFGIPVELILVDGVLQQIMPGLLPNFAWAVALLVVLVVFNILGTDIFAKLQTTLSFVMLVFMLLTAAAALSGHAATPAVGGFSSASAGMAKDSVILGVVVLAFWVFVGSEFVTPLVVEARDPKRDLPRAMILGLVAVFVVQMLFALGAAFLVPRDKLASSATPHLDYVVSVFGPTARIWFGVIAVTATASLLNTVIAAVPRMLQGMAESGQVFPIFKQVSRRYGTPVAAILFVAALPLIGLVWSGGDANAIVPLTVAASVAWILAYMVAQISLMVLRKRYPETARPFKVPGYPVTPVIALLGMGYVVFNCSPTPEMTGQIAAYTGIVLATFGLVGALWVKVVMKKGLFAATTPAGLDGSSDEALT